MKDKAIDKAVTILRDRTVLSVAFFVAQNGRKIFRKTFLKWQLGCQFIFYHLTSKRRKEVQNMQSALDRRQMILEALSDRRQETVENLAAEFGVSKRTIRYDIEILGCSAPIYTVQGGGGGIRVADGWYVGRRYLRSEQEQLLRELMDGLQPDQQKTMQSILSAFAMPKVKESKN